MGGGQTSIWLTRWTWSGSWLMQIDGGCGGSHLSTLTAEADTGPKASIGHALGQFKPVEHRGPIRPIGQHHSVGRVEGGRVVEGACVDGMLGAHSVLATKHQTTAGRTE